MKIPTNLYDNKSLRVLILKKLAKRRLKKFNIKLTEDRD
ncbi:Hypothetical protein Ccan_06300 [Capnocytophaga canimorsus Cc5]|uniref:Uncharacterized protein n=1 Tax=Capnocytophaga canimorsus (strain 5) TaxID=860228 RepID=F9YT08_CAPCC|nr:Hypothetical protein Ccan_06300 [Capnocytophaga canimorsus Cc5]